MTNIRWPEAWTFRLFLLLILLAAAAPTSQARARNESGPNPVQAQAAGLSPESHEKLTFRLQWGVLPVGVAVLESLPQPGGDFRFVLAARSNAFVDMFVKVRDQIQSVASPELDRSRLYAKNIQEGSHKRVFETRFDWIRKVVRRQEEDGKAYSLLLTGNTLDPLSVFYTFRREPLRVGASQRQRVTDGKHRAIARVDVAAREDVRVLGEHFDAYRVEVRMPEVDGIFRMNDDAVFNVWVTADQDQIPVKIECDIVIGGFSGHFTGSLIKRESSTLNRPPA